MVYPISNTAATTVATLPTESNECDDFALRQCPPWSMNVEGTTGKCNEAAKTTKCAAKGNKFTDSSELESYLAYIPSGGQVSPPEEPEALPATTPACCRTADRSKFNSTVNSSRSTTASSSRSTSPGRTSEDSWVRDLTETVSIGGRDRSCQDNNRARIVGIANGSRGDVEPMVALAQALKAHHHKVQLLVNVNFVDFCLARGIDAVPTFPDTEWVLHELGGFSGNGPEAIRGCAREAMKIGNGWTDENPGALVNTEDALKAFKPHIVVCGCQAVGPGMSYEKEEGVPMVIMHASRASLEVYGGLDLLEPPRPTFFAVSEFFDDRPLMQGVTRTGAWVMDIPDKVMLKKTDPLAKLQVFLKKGPAVAVGWGSMIPRDMPPLEMLWLALSSLRQAKRRGVILGGWARLDELGRKLVKGELNGLDPKWDGLAKFAVEKVFFINSAPHKWLFPKCSCVVHHGGAGTTHTALRAACPAVVTPIFADEFETAERVRVLSAGVGFDDPLPDITPEELAHAITRAERMADNAKAGSMVMRREEGAYRAARKLDEFLRREVLSGEWHKKRLVKMQSQCPW